MKKKSHPDHSGIAPAKPGLLSPIDLITVIYTGWIVLLMLAGLILVPDRLVNPEKHLPIYISIFTAVYLSAWLQRRYHSSESRLMAVYRFARSIYPVFMFGYFYSSGFAFNRVLLGDWVDPFFYRIDEAIFGYLPSMVWGVKYSHWAISELFHFAYFCYYPMIGGLPVYLYFKNRKAFGELIFTLTFTFYLCYVIYSLLPVIGGRFFPEAMELTKVYRGGPFTHIMAYIYNQTTHLGGAFPSSHVGVTLVLTVAGLKFTRRMGYLFVVIAFFLSLATVYCHYHWFIDAVAGVFTGIGGYYLGLYVNKKLQRAAA